ncbi:MAG TPA: phage Gp37/Gp68 family protein [Methylomirabilota bacterium]|nr:phage Gp37/Gp68 family protein [Methylomirabilota bacterium]
MENTKIEWADHTFNPWMGCTKVSPACAHCYAEALSLRYGRGEYKRGVPRVRTSVANWKQPLKWDKKAEAEGKRPRVFCASLSDWLDDEVPIEWLADLLSLIHSTPHMDWLLLTKRPENFQRRLLHAGMDMMGYVDGQKSNLPEAAATVPEKIIESVLGWSKLESCPSNVWIGTTVEDQQRANERIPHLLRIPARIRFLSCEPLLGPLGLRHWRGQGLHWVIGGGESGPGARPTHPGWATGLQDTCARDGYAFFWKQWGEWKPLRNLYAEDRDTHENGSTDRVIALEYCGQIPEGHQPDATAWLMDRVGKKAAGRLLDGREWNEVPQ